MQASLVYFVPQLNDPAVRRRLAMLRLGGLDRLLAVGFRRTPEPVGAIDGIPAVDLGRTYDGRLAPRVVSVARTLGGLNRWGNLIGSSTVSMAPTIIMARSLEALLLADAFRSRFRPNASLVYESLDIHRMLLGRNLLSAALRRLEARSMKGCDLLVTSSPAFVTEYFERLQTDLPPVAVLENRMLASEIHSGVLEALRRNRASICPPPGPPWRIGWFGLLRCSRSLAVLASLCRQFPGQVEVVIRGRPAANLRDEFGAVALATPGMTYCGPYDRGSELADIYSGVHFSWALDLSESGGNSDWLLPNRLYESGPFGCVPLAQACVETGRWLASRGAGVLLEEPLEVSLPNWFRSLDRGSFDAARAGVLRIPMDHLVCGAEDAAAFVAQLSGLQNTCRR